MNQTQSDSLIGTWRLVSFKTWDDEGGVSEPKGEHPFGYAVFTTAGMAFIHIAGSASSQLSTAERAASYVSYCGLLSIKPASQEFSVSVQASNLPDYIDTHQVRQYSINGDELIMGVPGKYQALLERC